MLDRLPPWRWLQFLWRRWSLWSLLIALVVGLLITLVWLAGRYEASQVQEKVERDTADALADVRGALARNGQTFQSLHADAPSIEGWQQLAVAMLRDRRELMRV